MQNVKSAISNVDLIFETSVKAARLVKIKIMINVILFKLNQMRTRNSNDEISDYIIIEILLYWVNLYD